MIDLILDATFQVVIVMKSTKTMTTYLKRLCICKFMSFAKTGALQHKRNNLISGNIDAYDPPQTT